MRKWQLLSVVLITSLLAPVKRFIDVKELAHAAVFLATNGAVNGSAQRVEGGIVRSI